jgi:hypothetical protein
MTYFGVNYYLSGMHSYAKGDPLPVPSFVYYTLAIVGLVSLLAWENQRRMKRFQNEPLSLESERQRNKRIVFEKEV